MGEYTLERVAAALERIASTLERQELAALEVEAGLPRVPGLTDETWKRELEEHLNRRRWQKRLLPVRGPLCARCDDDNGAG